MVPTYSFSVRWRFSRCSRGFHLHQLSSCSATEGVVRNGKSTAGHQRDRSLSLP
ncbi:IS1 family transposase [Shigella flexneri]